MEILESFYVRRKSFSAGGNKIQNQRRNLNRALKVSIYTQCVLLYTRCHVRHTKNIYIQNFAPNLQVRANFVVDVLGSRRKSHGVPNI